jgi:hypothetical protein
MHCVHFLPFVYYPAIQAIPLLLKVDVYAEVSCFEFFLSLMWDLYWIALVSSDVPLECVFDF